MKETLRTVGICFGCLALVGVLKRVLTVTLSHVVAGAQVMASDINGIIDQVNTNVTNIATNTSNATTDESNISNLQSRMTTAEGKITTLQGGPTFTSQITAPGIGLTAGSLTRISAFTAGSVTTTPGYVNHGLGTTPDVVLVEVTGTSTGVFTVEHDPGSMTGSQVKLTSNSASGVAVTGLAIKF
jgi:hypothetical protein